MAEKKKSRVPQAKPANARLRSGRLTLSMPQSRPTGQAPSLADPVRWLAGMKRDTEKLLAKLDILSVYDLLTHFPRAYVRRRPLSGLRHGEDQMVAGEIVSVRQKTTSQRRMRLCECVIDDGTGQLTLVFFNQPWLAGKLTPGNWISATGLVEYSFGAFTLRPQSWDILKVAPPPPTESEQEALIPTYPLTEGMTSAKLAALVQQAIPKYGHLFPPVVPAKLMQRHKFMPIAEALRQIHAPASDAHRAAAVFSLKYREFFLLEAGLALKHRLSTEASEPLSMKIDDELRKRCDRIFPFALTKAQVRAIDDICRDFTRAGRMNRLVQGDVGCGKTAVALYAMLVALDNGYQTALLAPTEILARQHYQSLKAYLGKTKVRVVLLTGSSSDEERRSALSSIASGEAHIAVGTHALLQPTVHFDNLGLVVVDEQHKFGVKQRAAMLAKGNRPHRLAMSATPIPRTLSLTVYGDLDLSVIDELPPGRIPVKTSWVPDSVRDKTLDAIHARLLKGEQAYMVLPLVEDNPDLELKSAISYMEEMKPRFSDVGVELVHGQMSAEEKERAMGRFVKGVSRMLVATVVIEVGVDVPAANIMVIEHAERFGLSQLHQLRGRIGRAGGEASLYLFAEPRTPEAVERLKVICSTTDGFKIAEADLRMRGFGDFIGTRQAGMPRLKLGDPASDMAMLSRARSDAFDIIGEMNEAELREAIAITFGQSFSLVDA